MPFHKEKPHLKFAVNELGIADYRVNKPRFELEQLLILMAAALLVIQALPIPPIASLLLCIAAVMLAGWRTALYAVLHLKELQLSASLFLSLSALILLVSGDATAAGWIMVFFRAGIFLIQYICYRQRKRLERKLHPLPKNTTLVDAKGNRLPALVARLQIGDVIEIQPGERIPLDCRCISESGEIDLSPLTGSKTLQPVKHGDIIPSGAINWGQTLHGNVTAVWSESTAAQIRKTIYQLPQYADTISGIPQWIATWLLPISCLLGLIAAITFPVLGMSDLSGGLSRLAALFAIASPLLPTAFVSLTVLSASAAAYGRGCILKTAQAIPAFADADLMMLEHHAVLAEQELEIVEIHTADGVDLNHLLLQAISLAQNWNCPAGRALLECTDTLRPLPTEQHADHEHGIAAKINGHDVYCGDSVFFSELTARPALLPTVLKDSTLYLVRDGVYLGCFLLNGKVPHENLGIARVMHEAGVADTILVTDADDAAAGQICGPCGIINRHVRQTPASIAQKLHALQEQGKLGAFVGKWQTQSPAMMEASISISVGLDDTLTKVPPDILMTHRNLRQLAEVKLLTVEAVHRLRLLSLITLGGRGILILLILFGLVPAWVPILAEVLLAAGSVWYGGRLTDWKTELS